MRRMNSSELICSRLSSLEHVNTPITTRKRAQEFTIPGLFFCVSPPSGHPPPIPFFSPSGASEQLKLVRKIPKSKVFPSKFSPHTLSNALRLFFILPMPSPWKSHTKSARAAGNPGFFKQIAPIFEKLLSADSKLDVCPRKGRNESGAGVVPGPERGQNNSDNVRVIRRTSTARNNELKGACGTDPQALFAFQNRLIQRFLCAVKNSKSL